jgi:hypothetical protein
MKGRSQMQGGKNWFLPKEINAKRFFRDSHLAKPLMSLYGTEWRERGYGLGSCTCAYTLALFEPHCRYTHYECGRFFMQPLL